MKYGVIKTFKGVVFELIRFDHTCHKLWTEICEIRQIFKRDLIKFCEIFIKITLELPKNSQNLYLNVRSLSDKHNKV